MKKILLVGNNDGGLYLFRKELIQRLIGIGYEVHFTVPYGDKVSCLKELGAIYHEIDVNRRGMSIKDDLMLMNNYNKLLKEVKPHIILTYTIKPNIYVGILAQRMKIPYIATITGLGTSLQGKGKSTKLIKALYRYSLKKVNYIFFQNEANKRFFSENRLIKDNNIVLVNGSGVNTEKFKPNKLKHKGINLLYISRIMVDKGALEYLEAAKKLKSKHNYVNFQMLGFYDEHFLEDKVNELVRNGIIDYLGSSPDTRTQMAKADCIVLPSYHEGMSNVLLEGASFGLPVITTNIHGCKEAVEDSVTGFLCGKKDTNSLIAAIEKFLLLTSEQRLEMGNKGRNKMIKEFNRELVVDKYIDAIKSIINDR